MRPLKKIVAPPTTAFKTHIAEQVGEGQRTGNSKDSQVDAKPEKGRGLADGPTTHETDGQGITQEAAHGTSAPAGTSKQVLEDAKELDRPTSGASRRSGQTKSSSRSRRSGESEKKPTPFPAFDPPAEALRGEGEESEDEEFEDHAFDHPSTYEDQMWVWLPKDTFGFSELLVEEFKKAGVDASDLGSSMDAKGTVEVTRNPPDEEWSGGHDR
ncbi:hypothetical protein PUNSTDRAFT_70309 [Punctularia strigosozonata HHB-11173 SS5]|uniref:uncharacterized protein n=1 Tax=Punctularia strigosozonata (strain HHB-11173) TaxID=741275 RepID=UPI0004417312|nr:uncharacterized protein PUNSTDRAFT_70309 [Punctularia strigosozonata HHB-11173 SS5]EIN07901.1 hypothetical protein PUNSTDRAFT_70309 [Punctularia strigosozonata HHB-11173 SS5]